MRNWDYGWDSSYFITICTKKRKHYFGKIIDKKIQLSEIGRIAYKYFQEIPHHFPFVYLGDFVIMPDHMHGIINIDKRGGGIDGGDGFIDMGGGGDRGIIDGGGIVEMQDFASLPRNTHNPPKNKFGPQSKNLASIVRGYKMGVKKYATMHNIDFAWQSRYYDHIIRTENVYRRISTYIINNPRKWNDNQ